MADTNDTSTIHFNLENLEGNARISGKPLTASEKAFWKDSFLACARSTLLRHNGKHLAPESAADLCANFADAAMGVYRSRVIWKKP